MIELAGICAGSFVLALSGALMPGPLLTVTVAESVKQGFRAGPLLITGHALLELLLVLAVVQGLGPYLESPPVMGIIALVGGGMLAWLGVGMVRSASKMSLDGAKAGELSRSGIHPVLMGVLASLSNPYWIIWWATIGLGYLLAAMKYSYWGIGVFFLGHIAADFAWYCVVSFGVSRGKSLLGDKGYQTMIRFCGVLLLGFGGWFVVSAKDSLGPILF